jgi:hypothetical protein
MIAKILALAAASAALSATAAHAQSMSFDTASRITCRDAQNMAPDSRRSLALYLADYSSRQRGVAIPDDARGGNLAMMVRGGCVVSPDMALYSVIDRIIVAVSDKLPRR